VVTAVEVDVVFIDVEVVLATTEELTASAVMRLTGDTVVEDVGTSDDDTVETLVLKLDVDCNVVFVVVLGSSVDDTILADTVVEDVVTSGLEPVGDCNIVLFVVAVVRGSSVADTVSEDDGRPTSDTTEMLDLERDVEYNVVLVEGYGSCVVI